MNKDVYDTIARLLDKQDTGDTILEVGPSDRLPLLALDAVADAKRRIAVDIETADLELPCAHELIEANANHIPMVDTNSVDSVFCHAVLEHDPRFWRTLNELHRVCRPGGILVVGVPGYSNSYQRDTWLDKIGLAALAESVQQGSNAYDGPTRASHRGGATTSRAADIYDRLPHVARRFLRQTYGYLFKVDRRPETPTHGIHGTPGDYYRFSKEAVHTVFLEGCRDRDVIEVERPPVFIGVGEIRQPAE